MTEIVAGHLGTLEHPATFGNVVPVTSIINELHGQGSVAYYRLSAVALPTLSVIVDAETTINMLSIKQISGTTDITANGRTASISSSGLKALGTTNVTILNGGTFLASGDFLNLLGSSGSRSRAAETRCRSPRAQTS